MSLIKLGRVSLRKKEESIGAIRLLRNNGYVTIIDGDRDSDTYDFDLAFDTAWNRNEHAESTVNSNEND